MNQIQGRPGPKRTPGSGRKAGVPNRATREVREAMTQLAAKGAPRLLKWLDEIYEQEGPKEAWKCFMDVIEYHIPKLARVEHTGEDGGAIKTTVKHEIVFRPVVASATQGAPQMLRPADVVDVQAATLIEHAVDEAQQPQRKSKSAKHKLPDFRIDALRAAVAAVADVPDGRQGQQAAQAEDLW